MHPTKTPNKCTQQMHPTDAPNKRTQQMHPTKPPNKATQQMHQPSVSDTKVVFTCETYHKNFEVNLIIPVNIVN